MTRRKMVMKKMNLSRRNRIKTKRCWKIRVLYSPRPPSPHSLYSLIFILMCSVVISDNIIIVTLCFTSTSCGTFTLNLEIYIFGNLYFWNIYIFEYLYYWCKNAAHNTLMSLNDEMYNNFKIEIVWTPPFDIICATLDLDITWRRRSKWKLVWKLLG